MTIAAAWILLGEGILTIALLGFWRSFGRFTATLDAKQRELVTREARLAADEQTLVQVALDQKLMFEHNERTMKMVSEMRTELDKQLQQCERRSA